jgi:hypothetical protein
MRVDVELGYPSCRGAYVRYSPDAVNWSTWLPLSRSADEAADEAAEEPPRQRYSGVVEVSFRQREEYEWLVSHPSIQSRVSAGDERAAVEHVVARDPAFFWLS